MRLPSPVGIIGRSDDLFGERQREPEARKKGLDVEKRCPARDAVVAELEDRERERGEAAVGVHAVLPERGVTARGGRDELRAAATIPMSKLFWKPLPFVE